MKDLMGANARKGTMVLSKRRMIWRKRRTVCVLRESRREKSSAGKDRKVGCRATVNSRVIVGPKSHAPRSESERC